MIHILEEMGSAGNQNAIVALDQLAREEDKNTYPNISFLRWKIEDSKPHNGSEESELASALRITLVDNSWGELENSDPVKTLHGLYDATDKPDDIINNSTAIKALLELIRNDVYDTFYVLPQVFWLLRLIGVGNPDASKFLLQLLHTCQDEHTSLLVAYCLGTINPGNRIATNILLEILIATQVERYRWRAFDSLVKTICQEDQCIAVVARLKHRLSDQIFETDVRYYELCYEVIWHCAQTLPYPEFYQAWHSPPLALHPEVAETTGVGFPPDSQSLNLAELPQLLRAATESDSELRGKVQLICIDSSKFIDRNNPAAYIYTRLVRGGCPRGEDGTPQTMPELQAYCDLLAMESNQHVLLVFYENPTGEAPRGFSESFLDALSKFDGAICVINDQPQIPLQTFSATELNLVEAIVAWIHRIGLEN